MDVRKLFSTQSEQDLDPSAIHAAMADFLFDRLQTGIAVFDADLRLRHFNDAWGKFTDRYAPLSSPSIERGMSLYALFDVDTAGLAERVGQVLRGEVVRWEGLRLSRDGIISHWDVVLNPLVDGAEILGFVMAIADASDRVFANQLLSEKEAQYRSIFEATSDGLIIYDLSGKIIEANPTACQMHGYRYDEMIGLNGEAIIEESHRERFRHAQQTADFRDESAVQTVNIRRDGSRFDVEVRVTMLNYRGQPHLLSVVRDVTERVQNYRLLEQRVEERTRELSTLLDVSNNITETLDLRPLLELILDQIKQVVDYSGAAVYLLEEDTALKLLIYRGPIPQTELRSVWPLDQHRAMAEVIRAAAPLIVDDVRGDDPLERAYRQWNSAYLDYVGTWMAVPLIVRDRVIGMLAFDHLTPHFYTPRLADLALAFASHAAAAVDNARLFRAEQDRRREAEQRRQVAEGLRDVLTILNSDRSLNEILDYIVMQTGRLLGTDSVAIFEIDHDDEDTLKIQMARGLADHLVRGFRIPIGQGAIGRAVRERQPITIADLPSALPTFDLMQEPTQRALMIDLATDYHALLAAPLYIKDEPYGGLVLYFLEAHAFTDEEIQLVVSLGDQTALAIENARLRAQAEQTAVAAERSRLARELHDAVTQTLFSASLIAEVLPRLWQRDQAEAFRRLADLRELTRGALAEMRMLLLELRPATLTEVELGDLIRQLGEAMMGRARIPIRTEIEGQGRLRPDVQIAFYRIAQETLNNIFKHAAAHEVHLRLVNHGDQLELRIEDDGRGFDPSGVTAEHLGLRIMRERAESVGASFDLQSEPGEGTRLDVRWRESSGGKS